MNPVTVQIDRRSDRCGFGLLEWIVALSILGIMMPVLFTLSKNVLRYGQSFYYDMLAQLDLHYIHHMLKNDLFHSRDIQIKANSIQIYQIGEEMRVRYTIKNQRLQRYQNQGILVMSSYLMFRSMHVNVSGVSKVDVSFVLGDRTVDWVFWMPNGTM